MFEIISVFFKLGCIAFGGPAAHIAMMEKEIIEKRKWMTHEDFLDLIGITNIIPGPNSTQMTMQCGYVRGGYIGLVLAGVSFILPAVLITLLFAIAFVKYGSLPNIEPIFLGIKPAVIGIILMATIKLSKKGFKNTTLIIAGLIVATLSIYGINEFVLIIGTALLGLIFHVFKNNTKKINSIFPLLLLFTKPATLSISSTSIFWAFVKIAIILYGSGYVLIAYVDSELVERLVWLTKEELLDAIAVGQFTPGPVLTTATFIGYQLKGIIGAIYASLGMFLPSFLFVGILVRIIPFIKKSKLLSFVLGFINAGAVGIMIAVTLKLSYTYLFEWKYCTIMVLSIIVAYFFKKVSSIWIVFGGAGLGYILHLIG
ncbi:MAG: chromate transporter [Crocinitomicaceae bacterium]|nr:chromate transporter [Crocinitomicaceae bacterium]